MSYDQERQSGDQESEHGGQERRPNEDSPPRRSSNRQLLLVLGGIGCVMFVVCGGIITLAVFWGLEAFTTDLPSANAAAEEFLDLIQKGHIEDAYKMTSSEFQSRQSEKEFDRYIAGLETFTKHSSRSLTGTNLVQNNNSKKVVVKITLHGPKNTMACTLELVEEKEVWKVNQLTAQ